MSYLRGQSGATLAVLAGRIRHLRPHVPLHVPFPVSRSTTACLTVGKAATKTGTACQFTDGAAITDLFAKGRTPTPP